MSGHVVRRFFFSVAGTRLTVLRAHLFVCRGVRGARVGCGCVIPRTWARANRSRRGRKSYFRILTWRLLRAVPARGRALQRGGLATPYRLRNFRIPSSSWRETGPRREDARWQWRVSPGWGRGHHNLVHLLHPHQVPWQRPLMKDSFWEERM